MAGLRERKPSRCAWHRSAQFRAPAGEAQWVLGPSPRMTDGRPCHDLFARSTVILRQQAPGAVPQSTINSRRTFRHSRPSANLSIVILGLVPRTHFSAGCDQRGWPMTFRRYRIARLSALINAAFMQVGETARRAMTDNENIPIKDIVSRTPVYVGWILGCDLLLAAKRASGTVTRSTAHRFR